MKKYTKHCLIALAGVLLSAYMLYADAESDFYDRYPELRGISNLGQEFFFSVPPALTGTSADHVIAVSVSSRIAGEATISIPSKNYSKTLPVGPEGSAMFELTPELAQAYVKSGYDPITGVSYQRNGAVRLTSDVPVSAKVHVRSRDSRESFLLYPKHIAGNEYKISSYNDGSTLYPIYNSFPSISAIVSYYDNNEITFEFKGSGSGGSLGSGSSSKIVLNKGDVWVLSSSGSEGDLSGSIVKSTKPVAVISACQSANIPADNKFHNYIVEQELPVRSYGRTYHAAALYNRINPPILRIFADIEDDSDTATVIVTGRNTVDTLSIDKETSKYKAGFLEYRPKERYVTLQADKDIFVAMYNTGIEEDGSPTPKGSPFQLSLSSDEHAGRGGFFSIDDFDKRSDGAEYFLMLFVQDADGQYGEVALGKNIEGEIVYRDINDEALIEKEKMPHPEGKAMYYLVELVNATEYVIDSELPVTAYLYGLTDDASFSYPVVMAIKGDKSSDNYAPQVSVVEECPGEISGTVCDKPDDDKIRSGLSSFVFDSENFDREVDPVNPGITKCASWSLTVRDKNKPATATVLFRDYAGNDTVCYFDYTPPKIDFSMSEIDFGALRPGETRDTVIRITNNSDDDFKFEKSELKYGNTGFSIISSTGYIFAEPGEFFDVTVEFKASENGIFRDSLGTGNNCHFEYPVLMRAVVGEPVIETSDIYFSTCIIDEPVIMSGKIFNTGVTNLIITDYRIEGDKVFTPDFGRDISPNNPLKIMPGKHFSFSVKCIASEEKKYESRLIFSSNALRADSIAMLRAEGTVFGLSAESYNFFERRINRPDFPVIPYAPDNEYRGIKVENIGGETLVIDNIVIEDGENSDAFEFNRNSLRNLKLGPGAEHVIPVRFNPKDTGNYYLRYAYTVKGREDKTAVTNLFGKGAAPKIEVADVSFGSLLEGHEIHSRIMRIKNLSESKWKWADTLNVYDLEAINPGDVTFAGDGFGRKGFRINLDKVDFSKPILPGEYLELTVEFRPNSEGEHIAEVNIISDAFNADIPPVILSAFVRSDNLDFSGGTAEVCADESRIITGVIQNLTGEDLTFLPAETEGDFGENFVLLTDEITREFTLASGDDMKIEVEFVAEGKIGKSGTIVLTDKAGYFKKSAMFTGKVNETIREISVNPVSVKKMPGETHKFSFGLGSGPVIDTFGITAGYVYLKYNPDILTLRQENIEKRGFFDENFDIEILDFDDTHGSIRMRFYSVTGAVLGEPGNMLDCNFEVLLPQKSSNKGLISYSLEPASGTCVSFSSAEAVVALDEFCGSDFRKIELTGGIDDFKTIAPNPADNSAELLFETALDGKVTIKAISIDGKSITLAPPKYRESGSHSPVIDISKLAQGTYIVVIETPSGIQRRKMIVR